MASNQQMTLTRTSKALAPANMSKATRQVVPAFLQKLYEMVNDPKNSDLIRWSDAGDTFFVLDHERFAHDVLGRWFKHRNFSSFVRQLNMYGFHKIPHLQQGVLKSDNETEFWNFAHPNFHRGQPDLLCLIQRKKTSNQANADDIEIGDASPTATTSGTGQVLDVHSIVNGITAIKRHQTTISTELNELKRSNQLLWQDAMAARQRHQKQQDTINRIVKFLAGVFGNNVNRPKDDSNDPGGVISRTRFMIEDAKREGKGIVELDDMDTMEDVATPQSTASVDDSTTTSVPSPKVVEVVTPPAGSTPQLKPDPQGGDDRALTPRLPPSSPVFDFNQQVQGMLGNLSHAQMQQLLSSLALQPNAEANSANGSNANTSTQNSHLAPYTPTLPPFDFSMIPSNVGPPNDNDNNQSLFSPASLQVPSDGLISFNSCDAFPHDRVERQWNQAEDIERDVSALSTSIQNLIDTYGLDPNLLDNPPPNSGPTAQPLPPFPTSISHLDSTQLPDGLAPLSGSEFDFDAFLNNLNAPSGDMDFTDAASTAFLDEVPSPAPSTSSPAQTLRQMSPEVTTNASGSSSGNIPGVSIPGSTSFGVGGSISTPPNTTVPLAATGGGSGTGTGLGRKRKSDVSDLDGVTRTQFQAVTPASILAGTFAPSNASTIPANSGAAATSKTKRRKEK